MRRLLTVIVVGVALAAASCASVPLGTARLPAGAAGASREMSGRLSVQYRAPSSDREETSFVNFDWAQAGDTVELALLDPLGQTLAQVHAAPGEASLRLRDGSTLQGDSPEALTRAALGWSLPVAGLSAWLWGHPAAPAAAPPAPDGDGNLAFHENGWTIVYRDAAADPDAAPRLIDLNYPGPGAAVHLRIVVDSRR